ncbi:Delta-1-pyrroline-5-carboxylate dehydrogenase, mitochondrial [Wickerhamiella sorbophila]|uniref:Multifunctional fusion protein n=1 Tax=Wickerhamiella sorbophila TaxID=45607 RepID=A0A2T0FIG7_9ASCO|nr:Delta-1-pyrroline-5-carboxylate dehydrogenase, mitochondrial [Wickerhamiella sorbophila]PRT54793.1 Delta-1-pyrroline-5-carboxylate dehydrogenase, mitochondrial [Wickerhamiella sorbophila]
MISRQNVVRAARFSRRASTKSIPTIPEVFNEPVRTFEPGSADREHLMAAVARASSTVRDIPLIIGGRKIFTDKREAQIGPYDGKPVASVSVASPKHVEDAIEASLVAKSKWAGLSWDARAAVFMRAADLITGPHRYDVLAATMVSQGKNAYQAEIDSTCELADFLRFNNKYAEMLYSQQPMRSSPGVWNRADYRPLEGFVYAVTPFNFTAIAGNLVSAPALVGNTVVWKPSANAALSNYLIQEILEEAGVPNGVINFVPGPAAEVTEKVLAHREFAGLHFTGSTAVFQDLYQKIAQNLPRYRSYPRIVGETGGKNFHLVHQSANVPHAALSTIRGAFEYQGQKCSATSRVYVAKSVWPEFKEVLVKHTNTITQGNSLKPAQFASFMGPVIHDRSFEKVSGFIEKFKNDPQLELLAGGSFDKSAGFYIKPTIFVTSNPEHEIMKSEFFGPLLGITVYDDADLDATLKLIDETSDYGLTGAVFAEDREIVEKVTERLEHTAGNFYINDKSTGAVVGQQWFGGARKSGTDDKAGSQHLLARFVTVRNIKENTVNLKDSVLYPSNF